MLGCVKPLRKITSLGGVSSFRLVSCRPGQSWYFCSWCCYAVYRVHIVLRLRLRSFHSVREVIGVTSHRYYWRCPNLCSILFLIIAFANLLKCFMVFFRTSWYWVKGNSIPSFLIPGIWIFLSISSSAQLNMICSTVSTYSHRQIFISKSSNLYSVLLICPWPVSNCILLWLRVSNLSWIFCLMSGK